MNNTSTQESMVSALKTIESVTIKNESAFLGLCGSAWTRNLDIEINGNNYKIQWYHNLSNLIGEFIQVPFNSITLNSPTYPVSNKELKLQLRKGDVTVAII